MIETYYSLGAMVVKFFANFLQITRRMTGVLFPADRFCPTEKRISAQTQPGVWTPKDLADVEPHTAVDPALHRLVVPETFDGSLVASTPPRGQPDHGQGHSPQPMRHDRRADPRRQSSVVLYRLTAANDLGLTDTVPTRIGELTDGRMRPITFATLLLIFKLPRRAASAGPAIPRCAFCRRSIGCATCFRPTTEPCTSASSPFSKTRSWVGHSG